MRPRSLLSPGAQIGPYEILGLLGAGGMGEVYKARDTRLDRTVAIKVLTAYSAGDAEGSKRLLREARAASALNHPHIVTIHDVLSDSGRDSLVMEYVEGRTLEQVIGKKALPLAEVLEYGIQIAGALAAAHAAGIIHRDLKPGNIMITGSGVKVLDFGLAKLNSVAPEAETASMTAEGVIAGTVAYMSPEQAEGRDVDARSDIFAFGSVLYEMAAGRPAFSGRSRLAILTSILHDNPPPLVEAPPELERLLRRCMRKDPVRRLHSMHDVRVLLEELRDSPPAAPEAAPAAVRIRTGSLAAGALALAAVAGLAFLWRPSAEPGLSSYRLTPFATEAAEENSPAWSPDGRTLAYEFEVDGIKQIYTRSLDAPFGTRVTNARAHCGLPFWTPDGSHIYYVSQRQLWSIGIAGGTPHSVAGEVTSAAVSPDGRTLALARGFAGDAGLWIASPPGASPQRYQSAQFPQHVSLVISPQFSPDGSKLAVVISQRTAASEPELWLLPMPSGSPVRSPVRMPVQQARVDRVSWMPDNRNLLVGSLGRLYMIDTQSGNYRPLTVSTAGASQPSVSPDGRRIAFASGDLDYDIVEVPFSGSSPRTVLATSRSEQWPSWSPSGTQYAYVSRINGVSEIWLRSVREEGARPLVEPDQSLPWYGLHRVHVSPDGLRIAYDIYGDRHVIAISSIAGGRPVILDSQSPDQHGPSWSPDGNWIAYRRLNGVKWELVKRPLGGGDAISLGETGEAGGDTDWSPRGEWLCHMPGSSLQLVSADGARHVTLPGANAAAFGFSRDGTTLYAVRQAASQHWELAAYAVPSGEEKRSVTLELPISASVSGFSVSPDGRSFMTSVGKARFDIWLLEGFNQRRRWFQFGNP